MTKWTDGAWWRAAGAAALLVATGVMMGILADRLWLSPPETHAPPLTAEAMRDRLGLSPTEEARVRALLDSLRGEIHAVVQRAPDSLGTAVRNAQLRIEAALPPDARPRFRAWLQEHHAQMTDRMHGASMDHGRMHGGRARGTHREAQGRRP